jgi:hypothetical protein
MLAGPFKQTGGWRGASSRDLDCGARAKWWLVAGDITTQPKQGRRTMSMSSLSILMLWLRYIYTSFPAIIFLDLSVNYAEEKFFNVWSIMSKNTCW